QSVAIVSDIAVSGTPVANTVAYTSTGVWTFYPSVTPYVTSNDLLITYGSSSATTYPSAAYGARVAGTYTSTVYYAPGQGSVTQYNGNYGDYMQAAPDYYTAGRAWITEEFGIGGTTGNDWSTVIGQVG